MSLIVHHLQHSQSERIVWLCEELRDAVPGFEYEVCIHKRNTETALAPSILKDIHPAGTAPIVVDETVRPRVVLAESQAIVEYLMQVHGHSKFSISPGSREYADYLSWYNFANGTFQACLTRVGTMDLVVKGWERMQEQRRGNTDSAPENTLSEADRQSSGNLDAMVTPFRAKLSRHHDMLEVRLAQSRYLASDKLTAADIMTVFSLTTMRGFLPYNLGPYPNILRYLRDISQRPAYRRALEKVEPGQVPMIGAKVEAFDFGAFK